MHEEEWIEGLEILIKRADDIPMCSVEFWTFLSYLKAIFKQHKSDRHYG